ncbi:MAG: M23 family metallopeptidase [Brevundimonas sp.]|uniref:M23 family metallopeptidase n=1 Tax=Brevundimonas sp. TaxID=1871086 RepID=UPI00391C8691
MRRLLPTARSFLTHSGQTLGLAAVAVMAMAAAPQAMHVAVAVDKPVAERPMAPPLIAEAKDMGPPVRIISFDLPIKSHPINSRFGTRRLAGEPGARHHAGIDIAAPTGTPVLATSEGVVTAVGYDRAGYGRYVEVRHPNGLRSFYAHMSAVDVQTGAEVAAGQVVGKVGSTGYSTGPHLHFEIRRGGARLNPVNYLGREFAVRIPGDHARG